VTTLLAPHELVPVNRSSRLAKIDDRIKRIQSGAKVGRAPFPRPALKSLSYVQSVGKGVASLRQSELDSPALRRGWWILD
jgi:hypothetical protein